MAETKTILVAGATGQQGGTVARSLLKRGHRVIGLTRNASKLNALAAAGIEGVQGDLTQRASMTPLLRKVDGFFVVTTPFEPDFSVHPEKEVLQGTTAIDAAKAASVGHVVLSSVASADRHTAFRVEGEGGTIHEGLAGPAHDRTTRRFHGQLREPLDDIVLPARNHGGSSPSEDAPTARGGEGHRGVRCSGI